MAKSIVSVLVSNHMSPYFLPIFPLVHEISVSDDKIIADNKDSAVEMLKSRGCCIYNMKSIFLTDNRDKHDELTKTFNVFSKFIQDLIETYDNVNDEFNINLDDYNITRLPRIGTKAHYTHLFIHLPPYLHTHLFIYFLTYFKNRKWET